MVPTAPRPTPLFTVVLLPVCYLDRQISPESEAQQWPRNVMASPRPRESFAPDPGCGLPVLVGSCSKLVALSRGVADEYSAFSPLLETEADLGATRGQPAASSISAALSSISSLKTSKWALTTSR